MIVSALLGGVAGKLASLGMAAKAGVGLGVAATATAGAVAVLPGAADNAVDDNRPALSVPAPDADAAENNGATPPGSNANAAATGLDRARQTPAGEHIPAFVPGRPNGAAPGSNANAAATGLDRARQTPAGEHIPAFVPGPPSDGPAGPPAGTSGARGTDTADQTPAGAYRPR